MFLLILCTGCASASDSEQDTEVEIPQIKEKGTVVVLATGSTIVGEGESGKETGYQSGVMTGEDMVGSVEGLSDVANIEVV